MNLDRRPDGTVDLAVMLAYEIGALDDDAVSIRFEVAETREQLSRQAPPTIRQIAMTLEMLKELAEDLTSASRITGAAEGRA